MLGSAAEEMETLCSDFPDYDKELLKGMLEDQAGDVMELRAVLRVSAPCISVTTLCTALLSMSHTDIVTLVGDPPRLSRLCHAGR